MVLNIIVTLYIKVLFYIWYTIVPTGIYFFIMQHIINTRKSHILLTMKFEMFLLQVGKLQRWEKLNWCLCPTSCVTLECLVSHGGKDYRCFSFNGVAFLMFWCEICWIWVQIADTYIFYGFGFDVRGSATGHVVR